VTRDVVHLALLDASVVDEVPSTELNTEGSFMSFQINRFGRLAWNVS
jgi:hypothetical protein